MSQINWFHRGISREDAEKLLLKECCEDGAFLIRECNSANGDFVLTLLHQKRVCHYQIRRHGGDAFFSIDDKVKILHGLESLVEFYQMAPNGLPTKLTNYVKKDLPPNDARRHGNTNLLHRATKENNSTIVSELLKCGYRNVDAKNQNGQTALHLAAIHSDMTILNLILATEVNVNCMDAFGNMPLHYACRTKPGIFIRHLIDANANVQGRNIKNGYVPLHEASKNGNLEAVKELLEFKAPLLSRTTSGEFPIDLARESGQTAIVEFLSGYKLPPPRTKKYLWYHGTLTREEAVESLQRYASRMTKINTQKLEDSQGLESSGVNPIDTSGCFLVRYSDRSGYVLTLLFEGQVKNFIISQSSKYLYIDEGPYLPTLEHLVQHFMHFNDGLPINLKYPVPPEPKPPQPLLSTLPRNKYKNKIFNKPHSVDENLKSEEANTNTMLTNKNIEKKFPEKRNKETANLVLSSILKIKPKVSTSSDEKASASNMENTRPLQMLEEFPCKGLTFSSNFISVGNESVNFYGTSANVTSLTLPAMDHMYNVPKNNAAIAIDAEPKIKSPIQGPKCKTNINLHGNSINWPRCATSEPPEFVNYTERLELNSPLSNECDTINDLSDCFIPHENIEFGKLIGEGEFGSVHCGQLKKCKNKSNDDLNDKVAIKTLRDEHCRTSKHDFLREASVMFHLKHHCIVQLIGLSKSDTLMMIQELAALGSMLNFIQNNRTIIDPNRELKLWASQIACGMHYLESQHFVHRDLAARNILLASLHQAKISDFGLSRALGADNNFYEARHGGKWPIKWYAPESYKNGIFSHSSDVWSYGVTLWEMFSLGESPYGEMLGSEAVQQIEDGKRLCQPACCPTNVYKIMEDCWQYNPKDRPKFGFLVEFFIKDPDYQNIIELVKTKSIS